MNDSLQRYIQHLDAPDPQQWKPCTGLPSIAEPNAQRMPLLRSLPRSTRAARAGNRRSTYVHGTSPSMYSSTAADLP